MAVYDSTFLEYTLSLSLNMILFKALKTFVVASLSHYMNYATPETTVLA